MTEKSLYHTYVQNHNGLTGTSFVEGNEGLALGVSSSLIDDPGTNPEQFIAFALSTCFNATIRIVENREHTAADSQLRTRVDIEKDDIGYKFVVEAQIRMPEHTETEAQAIIDQALNECPVAKLLKENENVSFKLVDDFTDEPTYGE
ncbi:OsmC family protein [Paucilactobacillus suebicus]|uniref:Redox protein, regulator of disulfide bond formation n=1 Tax=Paucilactobacillus suebicus DSM 5007 = KCTC 3549 TaxID=1423807 RepID=A0A0R1W9T7_9LACO|nr:OsmC family protein [Paucilactobacillus suebicus]KRM12612.1 redox protein, regulator of disulfide bond formation [Paucilactobacillus suebicus DSM 5007 = KCTC 3549]